MLVTFPCLLIRICYWTDKAYWIHYKGCTMYSFEIGDATNNGEENNRKTTIKHILYTNNETHRSEVFTDKKYILTMIQAW